MRLPKSGVTCCGTVPPASGKQYPVLTILVAVVVFAMDGQAYLFSADSGVGKSTHSRLWQQVFGDQRVTIINDDKPALRLRDGVWYVYGTPWSGKYGLNHNLCYPLAGICFLERSKTNKIVPNNVWYNAKIATSAKSGLVGSNR